jgi:transcriptional adapter 2-alpha
VCADFDLCLDCFSVGVELSGHKREHGYQVVDKMHFPIIDRRWGADEEILLLECIHSCGLGNWVDIADQLETKSPQQCEEHYYGEYINSKTAPFPDLTREFKGLVDKRDRMRLPPCPKPTPPQPSGPVLQDSGFMPKRQEFETEYFNEAELLLADMRTNGLDYPPTLQEMQVKVGGSSCLVWALRMQCTRRRKRERERESVCGYVMCGFCV